MKKHNIFNILITIIISFLLGVIFGIIWWRGYQTYKEIKNKPSHINGDSYIDANECPYGCYDNGTLVFRYNKKMITYEENDNEKFYYDSIKDRWFIWYINEKAEYYLTEDGLRDYINYKK